MLPSDSNYPNKKFNFEYLRQQMPSEPMLHAFFTLEMKNDGFTYDGWQGQNLCLAYRPTGGYTGPTFQDWSPRSFAGARLSPPNVHWCISEFVSTFDGLSLSHFQSKPKLCNGPCNRRNLNDDMQRKIRYNLLCGLKSIFVIRKLHTSLIKIKIMRRCIVDSFVWVAECK